MDGSNPPSDLTQGISTPPSAKSFSSTITERFRHVAANLTVGNNRKALGADSHVKHHDMNSHVVNQALLAAGGIEHQTYCYHADLLERGIKCPIVSQVKRAKTSTAST